MVDVVFTLQWVIDMNWHTTKEFTPLMLVMANSDAFRIRTLYDVGRVLLEFWPDDDGEKYVVAVKTCVDAITGETTTEDARRAFIDAAGEANIPVITIVR
ncbi:DUF982 domain-containing protein [Rhizobium sp. 2MFCol3.1]|uniref:DUF982 domain-containing protein n=1 Tax=Rhizobium sp. 2MFCol3.1 TaxID=1246459 RepID=UPI00036D034B